MQKSQNDADTPNGVTYQGLADASKSKNENARRGASGRSLFLVAQDRAAMGVGKRNAVFGSGSTAETVLEAPRAFYGSAGTDAGVYARSLTDLKGNRGLVNAR